MNKLIGKCGRYLWSEDIEPKSWIGADSFETFYAQHSLGRVYHCVAVEGDFIVIQSKREESYAVNPEGFDIVASTPFYIGDSVKILSGSKSGKVAIVQGIGWHLKNEKHIFILNINGKKSSRQYSSEDIEQYEEN